jgi:uncharacterized protein with HEPN domain
MQQRDLPALYADILHSGRLLRDYSADGFERYANEGRISDAIERRLQIIGEALSQAVRQDGDLVWKITSFRKIISFRHLLTHHYYKVSPLLVWNILEANLPQLEREVSILLRQSTSPGDIE